MNTIHKFFFFCEVHYILMMGLASKKTSTKQNDSTAIHLFWR